MKEQLSEENDNIYLVKTLADHLCAVTNNPIESGDYAIKIENETGVSDWICLNECQKLINNYEEEYQSQLEELESEDMDSDKFDSDTTCIVCGKREEPLFFKEIICIRTRYGSWLHLKCLPEFAEILSKIENYSTRIASQRL